MNRWAARVLVNSHEACVHGQKVGISLMVYLHILAVGKTFLPSFTFEILKMDD